MKKYCGCRLLEIIPGSRLKFRPVKGPRGRCETKHCERHNPKLKEALDKYFGRVAIRARIRGAK